MLLLFKCTDMDNQQAFQHFIQTTLNVNVVRVRDTIYDFVDTFGALLSVTDNDIDSFVKDTHSSNSGRAAAAKVLIPAKVSIALKAVLFELKDRELCAALPDLPTLQAIDNAQLTIMRGNRNKSIEMSDMRNNQSPPDMVVPKLSATNFEDFNLAFSGAARRQIGIAGFPLDYLLREDDIGNYAVNWPTREERIKMCIALTGQIFNEDSESLYNLLVQYVGTTGTGSNIITRHKNSKNGRKCYVELKNHFMTASYGERKAQMAEKSIRDLTYSGEKRLFTIENYYDIFTKAFNDLDDAGGVYSLTEEQKINKFENGLREEKSIGYSITARKEWGQLAGNRNTFEQYFTLFSASLGKHNSLVNQNINRNRPSRINEFSTRGGRGGGRGGRRGGRNSYRGRGRGGRGHGRNRGNSNYNPYQFARTNGSDFTPESKMYPQEVWNNLTREQQASVHQKKAQDGWVDGKTPPEGFKLNYDGKSVPNVSLVNAINASIMELSTSSQQLPLPPTPTNHLPPVPPIVTTNARTAGQSFGRSGTRQRRSDDSSTIASVTINGRQHNGPVFDANGNPLL